MCNAVKGRRYRKRRLAMKALVLSTAAVVAIAFAAGPAPASVMSVGGPLSFNCYQAADRSDARPSAIDSCTRALDEENLLPADKAATHVNRGIVYRLQSRAAAAESDFNQAIAIDPSLSEAWLNKAYLKLRQNRAQEALPLIEKGIQLGAQRPAMAYLARGLAHEDLGDVRHAYEDLAKARDLEPTWAEPGKYLARYSVHHP
jgi:tetratricopeptide (TPR) repeat protein